MLCVCMITLHLRLDCQSCRTPALWVHGLSMRVHVGCVFACMCAFVCERVCVCVRARVHFFQGFPPEPAGMMLAAAAGCKSSPRDA